MKFPFVQPLLRTNIILKTHQLLGHGGPNKIVKYLQLCYYWGELIEDAMKFIKIVNFVNKIQVPLANLNLSKFSLPMLSLYQSRRHWTIYNYI